jgi:multidrug efflux pump subunit AcrA (membrane-fusion protein)
MQEFRGLTAELYQAIVAIVDDRLREVRVTREGFERLEGAIDRLAEIQARTEERVGHIETRMDRVEGALERLAEAQVRTEARVEQLAEAQTRTDARLGQLAEAQVRTEARLGQLAEAQTRTDAHLEQLAEAQTRTEARLGQLAEAQARTEATLQRTQDILQQLTRQVGGLSETVGGDSEDIAYIVLYDVLKREFGWEVGVLERMWQQWNGGPEEIDIFGQATDPAHPERTIWIVGEAKHNLTLREVERFAQQVERARQHLAGEVYAVCFAYRARPEVRARLKELQIPLLFSFGRFA